MVVSDYRYKSIIKLLRILDIIMAETIPILIGFASHRRPMQEADLVHIIDNKQSHLLARFQNLLETL